MTLLQRLSSIQRAASRDAVTNVLWAALLAVLVCGAAFAWAAYRAGSLSGGLAYLRGAAVYATVERPFVEDKTSEQPAATASVVLHNITSQPVRIVGYNNPCACVQVLGLPLSLPPRKQQHVRVEAGQRSDGMTRDVVLRFMTDSAASPEASVTLRIPPHSGDSPPSSSIAVGSASPLQ